MKRLVQLTALLLVLGLTLAVCPAEAQRLRIIPVPPDVVPQWTRIPDLPQVYYAPNIRTDVFRHRGRYYFYWAGAWYRGRKISGPWNRLNRPPAVLYRIQATYYKTLPQKSGKPLDEGLVTPEGKPAVPPPQVPKATPPVSPQPPAAATAPSPQKPAEPQPPKEAAPPESPESQESAPQAVPEGPMPKAM